MHTAQQPCLVSPDASILGMHPSCRSLANQDMIDVLKTAAGNLDEVSDEDGTAADAAGDAAKGEASATL